MVRGINTKVLALPAYIILCIAFYAIAILNGFPEPMHSNMLIFERIISVFGSNTWVNAATSLIAITSMGFIIGSFINKHYLTGLRTYLPLFFNFMLFSAGNLFINVTPGLFAVLIMLFALNAIFESFDKEKSVFDVNSAAIGISVAIMLYYPFIYLIPFLLATIVINKQFGLKNILSIATGIISLPLIFSGLAYYYDLWSEFITPFKLAPTENNLIVPQGYWLFLGTITIWSIFAYILFVKEAAQKKDSYPKDLQHY